jgi:two-component system chemotaxis response regulator CheY
VVTAADAEEAFEAAQATPFDLVITDYQMPGMSGLDLARKLHAEPGKKHLPVMLLTAHGLALEQVELAHAGVTACLSKPFSPRDLLAKVHELLEARAVSGTTADAAPVA